jgi:FtsZ-binding cell division protein ZapB
LEIEVKDLVKLSKKIKQGVADLAMAPLSSLENKERNKRLEERLNRSRQKQKHLPEENK